MKISPAGWKYLAAGLLALSLSIAGRGSEPPADLALAALRANLVQEQGWTKVHAAEVLAAHGDAAVVHTFFLREWDAHGTEPRYRQGIRRTLARTATTPAERRAWIESITAAVIDPAAPDRVHALESLVKLGPPHAPLVQAAVEQWLAAAPPEDAVFIHWLQWQVGDSKAGAAIAAQLDSTVRGARARAAYALRCAGASDAAVLAILTRAADTEPADSTVRVFLVGAAYRLQADRSRLAAWRAILDRVVAEGLPGDRFEALQSILPFYQPADLPRLLPLLKDPHGDVRTGAAWAILSICDRNR